MFPWLFWFCWQLSAIRHEHALFKHSFRASWLLVNFMVFFLVNIMSFELMQMIRSICQTFGLGVWGLGLLHLISFAGPSLKLVWPFMPVFLLCPSLVFAKFFEKRKRKLLQKGLSLSRKWISIWAGFLLIQKCH
jgi:hypothetical protein